MADQNFRVKRGLEVGVGKTILYADPGGNVGVATINPQAILHVVDEFLLSTAGAASTQRITERAYTTDNGTLSWEGSAGQLFSITNNLTSGSIFSVNDVSGIPSIDVDADGTIQLAPFGSTEFVGIGTTNPTAKLDVNGTLNVSGVSTFQSNVNLGDNVRINFGDNDDFSIRHTGSHTNLVDTGQGNLYIAGSNEVIITNSSIDETKAKFITNGAVELYYDNSKKFETTGYGVTVSGGLNVSGVSTFQSNVNLGDNDKIVLGDGGDFEIYHSGFNSIIRDVGTGGLIVDCDALLVRNASGNETGLTFTNNSSVDLYYDNSKKFETTGYGVTVSGGLNVSGVSTFQSNVNLGDNDALQIGDGADLKLFHNGSHSFVEDNGVGSLYLRSSIGGVFITKTTGEQMIAANPNGAVELYYDNSKKFETTGAGVTITGIATATTFVSTQTTGTAPFTVSSTTVVTNLNADLLDGQEGSYYRNASNINAGTIGDAYLPATISSDITGTATNANNINVADESTDTTCFPVFTTAATGNLPPKTGSNLTFNSSTGLLSATSLSGTLNNTLTLNTSGNGISGSTTYNNSGAATFTVTSNATNANTASTIVFRDASGNFSAGTITATLSGTATNANNINVADESIDTTCFPVFTTAATGNQAPKTGSNLTFNSSTGALGATTFVGSLNNTLTLNTSGNGISGSTTYNNSGASTFTVTSNATNANTASTIVFRDASGNFSAGTITLAGELRGPASFVIDPATVGDNTGTVVIKGNLQIDGTTTTVNSTTITVDDKNIELGSVATPSDTTADSGGITLKGSTDKTFNWINATDSWTSSENIDIASGKTYKINTTDVLSATTLGSGVVNSSLTSLGTIGTGVWQGTAIDDTYIGTIDNANKVSLSALNIDGGTATTTLADADLFIVDDGANGTNRKITASNAKTYFLNGNAATATTATNVTVADESTDATCFPLFVTAATGNLPPKSGSNLTFNSSTGALGATTFVGNLNNTLTMNTSGTGLSGSTTYNNSGAATFTVTSNATNANTASTIVARDASGNFSAGTITAALSGNATSATTATNVTVVDESADTTCFPLFVTDATGNLPPKSGSNLTFNSSTGLLSATSLSGTLNNTLTLNTSGTGLSGSTTYNNSGAATFTVTSNATSANTVSTIVARDASGNFSAGTITATLSGNATTATTATNANNINVADESTDTTCFPVFTTEATGNQAPKTGSNLTFNSSTGALGATTFVGSLQNTLTLNTSGNGISGSTTYNNSGASTFTVTSNATNANTASTIVARDASGNFSAGTITATLSGNATTATTATQVSNTLTRGTYLTGNNYNGSAATTWAVDATSANTVSKVVARDASGNFSAGTITATLSGNATTATTATNANNINISANTSTDTTTYPVLVAANTTGNQSPIIDNVDLSYNASTGQLSAVDFNTTSDERLKTDIKLIEEPIKKLSKIRGVDFRWKNSGKSSAGVIAQEVEKVLPHLVTGEDKKGVNYNGLIGLLIEVVKEQQTQINSLNERLSKLE